MNMVHAFLLNTTGKEGMLNFTARPRGVLSGNVGTWRCGPDRVPFRPLRFTNDPFLFENWFIYRLHFSKMLNF